MSNFSQFVTGANEREREGREGGRENNGNDKSSKLFKKTSRHIHSMSLTEKKI